MALTAEELLAGSELTHTVEIPAGLLNGNGALRVEARDPEPVEGQRPEPVEGQVVLKPLTVQALQRIGKASRDDETLSATLMIQQALVEPGLKFEQVTQLPAGLARFLVEQINTISGIDTPRDALEELVQAPLARACFVLAKEFGWTPEEVSGMTIGQILLYLEMAHRQGEET